MSPRRPLPLVVAALTLALATSAFAVDGVREISHACAVGDGCFSGDGARYPVTIVQSGSYRLTSDLAVPDENTSAIRIEASDVTIDLNGFAISGVTTCSGLPPACASVGTGNGVEVDDDGLRGSISVRNGSIRGMGHDGIRLGWLAVVENVRVRENGVAGIELAASHGTVRGCQALSNGSHGIVTAGGLIADSVASANGQFGIQGAGTISGNTAELNGSGGIRAYAIATVAGNTASGNRGHGIDAAAGSTVEHNTASDNALLGGPPYYHGIVCADDCTVRGNTASMNSGFGLSLGADAAYGANTLANNGQGGVSGGVNTGANHCSGANVVSAACP